MGLDATAELPLEKLRKQLEVNLVGQLSVTKVRLASGQYLSTYFYI